MHERTLRETETSFMTQDRKNRKLVADVSTTGMNAAGGFAGAANSLAGRYAKALYELAADRWLLDEVIPQVQALGDLIAGSEDFRSFVANRTLPPAQATSAVLAVLAQQGFGETVRNFVGVIATNRRLSRLPEIIEAFAAVAAAHRGEIAAGVVSAQPLTDVQRVQLRARLAEAGYSHVSIHERVDETLLGGLVVSVGARVYDTSLKGRLTRLHNAMKGAA